MKRKRRRTKKILWSILLFLLAFLVLGAIGFVAASITQKNKEQQEQAGSVNTAGAEMVDTGTSPGGEGTAETEETTGVEVTPDEAADPAGASEAEVTSDEAADPAGNTGAGAASEETAEGDIKEQADAAAPIQVGEQTFLPGFTASADEQTIAVGDTDVLSKHALLIDLGNDRIVAGKDADVRIYPASMTKILTILVAAEHMGSPEEQITIPQDSVAYCLGNGCSAAGFVTGEVLPVKDLFYGTILPSGGEAAVALAIHTAGSHEAFVELMNQKAQELGIADTAHFTNCVGVYDDAHYCTLQDMAMILKAAVENDFCREVLQTHVYYTTHTEQNPEGIILSNWFLRRIEDKDCGGTVVGAKTGFVNQSGDCAASYFVSNTGEPYICVTADTYNSWRCIDDHVAMYKLYTK